MKLTDDERKLFESTLNGDQNLFKSPIECRFFAALRVHMWRKSRMASLCHNWEMDPQLRKFSAIDDETPYSPLHLLEYEVIDFQFPIEQYRADFVWGKVAYEVRTHLDGSGKEDYAEVLRKLPIVVIECDGHDFHEKTKEQAAHDKRRDRRFATLGYRVMRFTGSEIHRDPMACVLDVEEFFESMYSTGSACSAASLLKASPEA